MTVDRREVDQMARLIALMNGQHAEPEAFTPAQQPAQQPARAVAVSESMDPGVAAMRSILERFQGSETAIPAQPRAAEPVTRSLLAEAQGDRDLRTAMITEATTEGVRIGDWEIRAKLDGKRKFFDVVSDQGAIIAADLTLYEAAFGIAQALSEGHPITTQKVRAILRAEGDYAAALHDAIHFKHTLTRRMLEESRRPVIEDRYEESKHKAARAKAEVERLVGRLPF